MTGDTDQTEPGEFSTIEAAKRAAGFTIPYPRDLIRWQLESVKVKRPSFGIGDPAEVEAFRFVTAVYSSEPPGRSFRITTYMSDGTLRPMNGEGTTSELVIAGRRTLFYTAPRSFWVSWLVEGLQVSISGWLYPPDSRSFSPTWAFESPEAFNAYAETLPPLDVDDVLKIVESTR